MRAGIIGEIGFQSATPAEEKSLRGAGMAQRETGAALNVHVPFGIGLQDICYRAADILAEAGADLSRVIFSHQDLSSRDPEYEDRMLARGITLEADCFGIEMTTEAYGGWDFPSDRERIDGVAALVARGWADQVLISTDVCMKFQLRAYGGDGFGHILDTIVPRMRRAGIPDFRPRQDSRGQYEAASHHGGVMTNFWHGYADMSLVPGNEIVINRGEGGMDPRHRGTPLPRRHRRALVLQRGSRPPGDRRRSGRPDGTFGVLLDDGLHRHASHPGVGRPVGGHGPRSTTRWCS